MEPQGNNYCYENKEVKGTNKKNCFSMIANIILTAFALVLGIIVGAEISVTILEAISAIIVLAIVLGLLFILTIIAICIGKKDKRNKYKCCK